MNVASSSIRRWAMGAALGGVLTLTACDSQPAADDAPPQAGGCGPARSAPTAIVWGARANTPRPELPAEVYGLVDAAVRDRHKIVVVNVDGSPAVTFDDAFESSAGNDIAFEDDLRAFTMTLSESLRSTRAQSPEAGPLAALDHAARAVGKGGTIVLADSGLQTVAPLDFTVDGMLDADPTEVVDGLAAVRQVPDLTERTVVMVGIGDVAAPQDALGLRRRENVVAIWEAIVRHAGGTPYVCREPRTGPAVDGVPPVRRVPVPPEPALDLGCDREEILRDGGSVGFVRNTDEFRDEAAARQALERFAAVLLAEPRSQVQLTGTTSSAGTEEGRLALSRQRAEAVERVLIELRVPADRISTEGVGTHWAGHVNDRGPSGELLPGPAAQNRSVVVKLEC